MPSGDSGTWWRLSVQLELPGVLLGARGDAFAFVFFGFVGVWRGL